MNAKKIIVAVSMDEEAQRPLRYLKEIAFSLDAEIQLVNMVIENILIDVVEFALTFPTIQERRVLEDHISKKLEALGRELFPQHKNVSTVVLFDTNIRAAFTEYVKNERADFVVIATRGRHGIKDFFDSSFAQHQVKYSPTNVLVLR